LPISQGGKNDRTRKEQRVKGKKNTGCHLQGGQELDVGGGHPGRCEKKPWRKQIGGSAESSNKMGGRKVEGGGFFMLVGNLGDEYWDTGDLWEARELHVWPEGTIGKKERVTSAITGERGRAKGGRGGQRGKIGKDLARDALQWQLGKG